VCVHGYATYDNRDSLHLNPRLSYVDTTDLNATTTTTNNYNNNNYLEFNTSVSVSECVCECAQL